jgi:hypothetical protein
MLESFFCVVCVFAPLAASILCLHTSTRFTLVLAGFLASLSLLLLFTNQSIPFSAGEDDVGYYMSSKVQFNSINDWFDLKRFSKTHAQPGYSLLNAWVHQIVGPSLLARKFLNIAFFGLLAVWWAYIGQTIGGPRISLIFGLSILAATPLWFYTLFLFKDMLLTLLESLIIGAVSLYLSKRTFLKSSFIILATSLLIIPLRLPFVVFNFLALSIAIAFHYATSLGLRRKSKLLIIAFGILAFIALSAGTQTNIVESLGMRAEQKVDFANYRERLDMLSVDRKVSRFTFPVLYLIGETQAFNTKSWTGDIDAYSLRGALWVPWVFFGVPLFFLGCIFFMRGYWQRLPVLERSADFSQIYQCASFANDYRVSVSPVFVFAIAFAVLSWIAGDTTRYRIASIPPLMIIAATGYAWFPSRLKFLIVVQWLSFIGLFIVIYYIRRG